MSVRWELWDSGCFVGSFLGHYFKVLEKGSGRYSNSHFADAPGKQQHLQMVSHLLTKEVRNKNKDSYDPSDNIEQVCFVVRHKQADTLQSENDMDLIHLNYH